MIDHPREKGVYGGAVAGPAVAKIIRSALRSGIGDLRLTAVSQKQDDDDVSSRSRTARMATLQEAPAALVPAREGVMPDLRGLSLTQALRLLEPGRIKVEIIGRGARVDEQLPAGGEALSAESTVRLRLR
jgi:hypothetical protein